MLPRCIFKGLFTLDDYHTICPMSMDTSHPGYHIVENVGGRKHCYIDYLEEKFDEWSYK